MAAVQAPPAQQQQPTASSSFEYRSLKKVQGIPVVRDSLGFAHETLSKNPYTSYVYARGLNLSTQAYELSKPVQARLQPLLVRADTFASSGIDAVEARFPYPFKTPTEEIFKPVKDASDQAYSTFDVRVRQPAVSARDQLVTVTSEQFKQLQQHNVLVQRAIDSVYKANESLSSATKETNTRVHQLSDRILAELHNIQASTAALPGVIQSSTKPLQSQLSQIVGELQSVIKAEGSASQKASNVASAVQNQVGPVLEAFKETYGNLTKNLAALRQQHQDKAPSPSLSPSAGEKVQEKVPVVVNGQ